MIGFFLGLLVGLATVFVLSLCKAAKMADQVKPMGIMTHDPEQPAEDLEIPAFLRYQDEEFPRERKNRE